MSIDNSDISSINPVPEPDNSDFVRASIAGETYVQISRLNKTISWSDPVHALNWFDTRLLPLYNFYNFVAARSVTRVGGRPIFKGELTKHIAGNTKDLRTVLLIVRYPSPLHFKDMVENLYFKVVSILRGLAVKEFTFCLTHTVQDVNVSTVINPELSYAVHHFSGAADAIEKVQATLSKKNIQIEFSSCKTHTLSTSGASGVTKPIPALMDGLILISAPDSSSLETLFASADYQHIIGQTDSSFIGLFKRVM